MITCCFATGKKGESCPTCGYTLRRDYKSPPRRVCSNDTFESCQHFVCWTDRSALSLCGCKSAQKNGTPTTVAECDLHGDVTPLAKKTKEGLPTCQGCPDYRPR